MRYHLMAGAFHRSSLPKMHMPSIIINIAKSLALAYIPLISGNPDLGDTPVENAFCKGVNTEMSC